MRALFVGHDFKFARRLMEHFAIKPGWTVTQDSYSGHVIKDTDRSAVLVKEADLVFCEWSLGNAEWYSHHKQADQLLIVRLHHQEMELPFLDRIAWEAVDALVFICPAHQDEFVLRFPHVAERTRLIFNLIDCHALDQPKSAEARFSLGFMGTAPMRKAPHRAVDILERVRAHDPRFRLRIKGKHPWEYDWLWRRSEERAYYESLYARMEALGSDAVRFDEHGDDVPDWFRQVGFVLSTSDHEGSHQAVAEGMASGAVPVIRNWHGADGLYPQRHIFDEVDQAVERLLSWVSSDGLEAERDACRRYARERFDLPVVTAAYDELLDELLSERASRST